MMDKIADLLIDTETALWEARANNERERTAESRQALRLAQERLAAVQAEAEAALWSGLR